MTRYTMLIDLQRCVGCWSCTVACKQENNVPPGVFRNHLTQVGPFGEFPNVKGYFLPRMCMHCENAACVAACPTGASYQMGNGLVAIHPDACHLCQSCITACPHGARQMNENDARIEVCDLCLHRITAGEMPACAHHCIGKACFFGDLDDPQSEIARYLATNQDRVVTLWEAQGTKPRLVYLEPKVGMLVTEPSPITLP